MKFFLQKTHQIDEKDVAVCPKFCLPILVGLSLGNFLQFLAKWLGFMVGKLQIQNQDEKLVWLDVSIVSIGQFWTKSLGSWAQLKIQILKSQIFVNAQTFGGLIWKESNLLWKEITWDSSAGLFGIKTTFPPIKTWSEGPILTNFSCPTTLHLWVKKILLVKNGPKRAILKTFRNFCWKKILVK